jgi:glycosyltransferase involved in cell wall biosynthesis
MQPPLISCLCVTRKRTKKLARAIRCFQNQTYPNKELLIIYENDDPETAEFLKQYNDPRINAHKVSSFPKRTLGALRNLAIEKCHGEFFAQWDDDDWYHARRLESQFNMLASMGKPVSILVNWLMFHEATNKAYVGHPRLWEGSILAHKGVHTKERRYSQKNTAEDTDFVGMLVRDNLIYPTILPQLYIYTFHETNSWGEEHSKKLCETSAPLPEEVSAMMKKILDEELPPDEGSRYLDSKEVLATIRYF